MKTTQHTPEPWEYTATASLGPQYAIRPEADGPHICIVYQNGNGEANAARIVACVNACSGLFDPAADLAALREALQGLVDRHAALVNSGDCGFWKVEEEPAILAARAALARTERRPA